MCVCLYLSLSLFAPWWWHCRQPSTLPLCPLDQCEGRSQPQVTSDQSKIHDCTDCFNLPSVQMCSNIMAYHGISWHTCTAKYYQLLSHIASSMRLYHIVKYQQHQHQEAYFWALSTVNSTPLHVTVALQRNQSKGLRMITMVVGML